jgi:hypothetical protein
MKRLAAPLTTIDPLTSGWPRRLTPSSRYAPCIDGSTNGLAKPPHSPFQHKTNCQALFEDLWCGYECSPHRPQFLDPYDTINEEQGMRICSSFCQSLYEVHRPEGALRES